jgi:hypothetical protein
VQAVLETPHAGALLCRNYIGGGRNYIELSNQSSDAAYAKRQSCHAWRVPMNRYKKYRQNAADCFAVAQQLSDLGLKASMLEMAQSWLCSRTTSNKSAATIAKLAICRFRRGSNGANSQRARRSYRSGAPKLEKPQGLPPGLTRWLI